MNKIEDKWTIVASENLKTNLSIAIFLIDDYSKKRPLGRVRVSIKDKTYNATKNPSGYYIFLSLPPNKYTIQVSSDFYFYHNTQKIDVIHPDPAETKEDFIKRAQKEIVLKPNPTYPFPDKTTLIRGIVQDQNEKPVQDAILKITEKNFETKTNENGEYVIYFKSLEEKKIHVEITHSSGLSGNEELEVEEGTTKIKYIKLS